MKHGALEFKTRAAAQAHIDKHELPDADIRAEETEPLSNEYVYQIVHKRKVAAAVETETKAKAAAHTDLLATWTLPANIMEMRVPEQRYAIRPYFPLECATGLAGQGKVGKSYLTLYALLCVAAGRPFFGCEVQGGDVWYFSAEDRPDRVMERAQAILADFTDKERALATKRFHAIDAVGRNLFFVAMVNGGATITNVAERIAAAVGKAVLICVDTVSRVNPLSEQSNETMALIVSAAEKIASLTGAAVCLNTHVGKAQARSGETDMYAGRGGSAFGDNCRSIVVLSRATDKDAEKLTDALQAEQRENNLLILTHAASSYGREAMPLYLVRRDNGTIGAVEGEILRDESRDTGAEMQGLLNWYSGPNKTRPFSVSEAARHSRKRWTKMTQRQTEAFLDQAIDSGLLASAGKGPTGGILYLPAAADPFSIN
jgi:RecA-family ATPase